MLGTDNQTIITRYASFYSRGKNERIQVAICDPRSSSALIERPRTACRLRNLADFIFSTTTTSVDDADLDDSSRTHISQSVRSCGNFDIPEYGAMRKQDEILCFPSVSCIASILDDTSNFLDDRDLH